MQLTCPRCGKAIAPEHVNLQTTMAKCRCGEVFGFGGQVPTEHPPSMPAGMVVSPPRAFSIRHDGATLVLTRHWFIPGMLLMLLICLMLDVSLVIVISNSTCSLPGMILFSSIMIPINYLTLGMLINNTEIRIDARSASVRIFPLPWSAEKTLYTGNIAHILCEKRLIRGRHQYELYNYNVIVVMENGVRRLLTHVPVQHHAEYIKQQIEQHLGIGERPCSID